VATTPIEWVNHASDVLRHGPVNQIRDPWLEGPAFDSAERARISSREGRLPRYATQLRAIGRAARRVWTVDPDDYARIKALEVSLVERIDGSC
jgi:hypothetical protein